MSQAEAIDAALQEHVLTAVAAVVAGSFALSLRRLGRRNGRGVSDPAPARDPVSWSDALVLESLGQAIRGAAFAIPGSLGVQEGGYLLLAPLAGLPPEAALALSLAKRAREVLLGRAGPGVFAPVRAAVFVLFASPMNIKGLLQGLMRAIILAAGRGIASATASGAGAARSAC